MAAAARAPLRSALAFLLGLTGVLVAARAPAWLRGHHELLRQDHLALRTHRSVVRPAPRAASFEDLLRREGVPLDPPGPADPPPPPPPRKPRPHAAHRRRPPPKAPKPPKPKAEKCAAAVERFAASAHGLPLIVGAGEKTWVYRNGAEPTVNYSHMAMLEELPGGAGHILVWQAAAAFAGVATQHVRASVSTDLQTWSPSFAIDLPAPGAVWAPVLFLDRPRDRLLLFYAESSSCTRQVPGVNETVYGPGGDIKMVHSADGRTWSAPAVVYGHEREGGIPKVVANRPVALAAGPAGRRLLLPFWREHPGPTAACPIAAAAPQLSGTLLSDDGGASWRPGGDVLLPKHSRTLLLEGAIVPLGAAGEAMQFFRSTTGAVYTAVTSDGGETWSEAARTDLPNPNSKLHAIEEGGRIWLAYNHHKKLEDEWGGIRTNLWVSVSADRGRSWRTAARLEDAFPQVKTKFHYPTLLSTGPCSLAVAYTIGLKERASAGGVVLAEIDLARLKGQVVPGQVFVPDAQIPAGVKQDEGGDPLTPPKKKKGGKGKGAKPAAV